MKRVLFGLSAVAIGALAVPTIGAAQMPEGAPSGRGAATVSGGGGAAPGAAGVNVSGGQAGANANANVRAAASTNASVREGRNTISTEGRSRIQSNIRNDRLVSNRGDRRDRRFDRDVGFAPGFAAYGEFYDDDPYLASYDSCWNYVWTPLGYERVNVCGTPGFYAAAWPALGFGFEAE